jgi:hypothetical protein
MKNSFLARIAALRSARNAHVLCVHSAFCALCALQSISRFKVFIQKQLLTNSVIPTGVALATNHGIQKIITRKAKV